MIHTHHIIPRHMGGTDDPSNLIDLSIEDHAEAHKWLFIEHGKIEDALAWLGLYGQIGKEEIARIALSEAMKKVVKTPEWNAAVSKGKKEAWNKLTTEQQKAAHAKRVGQKRTEKTKQRMSQAKRLFVDSLSLEQRKEMTIATRTIEAKEKMSAAKKGKKWIVIDGKRKLVC